MIAPKLPSVPNQHPRQPDELEYDPGPQTLQVATVDAPDIADEQTIRGYAQERPAGRNRVCAAQVSVCDAQVDLEPEYTDFAHLGAPWLAGRIDK